MVPKRQKRKARPVFPFSRLPREVRDIIYEEWLIDEIKVSTSMWKNQGLSTRAKNVVDPRIPLVNKQSKQEYLDRAQWMTRLVVEDNYRFKVGVVDLPPCLQYVRRVECHVRLICSNSCHQVRHCHIKKEACLHRNWIQELTTLLPPLKSLDINVYLDKEANPHQCRKELDDGRTRFTTIEETTSVRVYKKEMAHDWAAKKFMDYEKDRSLVKEYIVEEDTLIDHEVLKRNENIILFYNPVHSGLQP